MRWRPYYWPEGEWRQWFAWYPVASDDGTRLWLEWVNVRVKFYDDWGAMWEYAPKS